MAGAGPPLPPRFRERAGPVEVPVPPRLRARGLLPPPPITVPVPVGGPQTVVSAEDDETPRTGRGSFCWVEASREVMRSANAVGDSGSGVISEDRFERRKLSSLGWLVTVPVRA